MYIQGRCLCRVGMFSPWLQGFSPWTGFLPHAKDVQLGEVACLQCPSLDLSECECGCGCTLPRKGTLSRVSCLVSRASRRGSAHYDPKLE